MAATTDVVVVGGGIVGLATARAILARRPGVRLTVFDKEPGVARHQSGHNSGVIHSGVYYRPGSLKARLCGVGRRRLLEYLAERTIAHTIPGKVIVATRPSDLPALDELERRARANGVAGLRRLDAPALREIEPEVRGISALHVPGTGIVDYGEVARAFAADVEAMGGTIRLRCAAVGARRSGDAIAIRLADGSEEICRGAWINCGGLQADRIARAAGASVPEIIVPFRGEYHRLRPSARGLVRGLVYPVPDPELPFVGVHFTPTVRGEVEIGPNAVLGFAREAYRRTDFRWADTGPLLVYPGFWRMARRFGRIGLAEMFRSVDRSTLLDELRRLVPALGPDDLLAGGAGVRAQIVDRDGTLCDDFRFAESYRALHVLSAPSPAATSALAIAEEIAQRLPVAG